MQYNRVIQTLRNDANPGCKLKTALYKFETNSFIIFQSCRLVRNIAVGTVPMTATQILFGHD